VRWLVDGLSGARGNLKLARVGIGVFGLTMSALMLVFVARAQNNVVAALLISVALFNS
jgi:hypothetical protein